MSWDSLWAFMLQLGSLRTWAWKKLIFLAHFENECWQTLRAFLFLFSSVLFHSKLSIRNKRSNFIFPHLLFHHFSLKSQNKATLGKYLFFISFSKFLPQNGLEMMGTVLEQIFGVLAHFFPIFSWFFPHLCFLYKKVKWMLPGPQNLKRNELSWVRVWTQSQV